MIDISFWKNGLHMNRLSFHKYSITLVLHLIKKNEREVKWDQNLSVTRAGLASPGSRSPQPICPYDLSGLQTYHQNLC